MGPVRSLRTEILMASVPSVPPPPPPPVGTDQPPPLAPPRPAASALLSPPAPPEVKARDADLPPLPPVKLDPLAAFLSYLIPGLGQVKQGRIGKGLLFF